MGIKNIFNMLLLSLSVTTLVITLISYVIFRLRYSLQKQHSDDLHHQDGVFFRRYAPHLAHSNAAKKTALLSTVAQKEFWRKRPIVVFTFIGVIITGFFASENYFVFRKELSSRTASAEQYRELVKQGLLKSFEFNPEIPFEQRETFSKAFLDRKSNLVKAIQNTEVKLYSPPDAKNRSYHKIAILAWEQWLKTQSIKNNSVTQCKNLRLRTVIIVPSTESLSRQDVDCLNDLMTKGASVVFSGNVGNELLHSEFALKTTYNAAATENLPTVFASDSSLPWEIPPGLLLSWSPLDPKSQAFSNLDSKPLALQSGFSGMTSLATTTTPTRFAINQIHRSVWTALTPITKTSEQHYVDNILLTTLAWTSRVPMTKISNWKNGTASATVLSINSGAKIPSFEELVKMTKNKNYPISAFLVTDRFLENLTLKDAFDVTDELASQSDNNDKLTEYPIEKNFERLQKSRLDLEEAWRQAITGFQPPEETANIEGFNAIKQSGFRYVFSSQKPIRLSPFLINNGTLVHFTRAMDDDLQIQRNRTLTNPDKIADHLFSQYQSVTSFGGAYFLSLHAQVAGEDEIVKKGYGLFLGRLQKQPTWKATFNELAKWWTDRDQVSVNVTKVNYNNEFNLIVSNSGSHEITGIETQLYLPDQKYSQIAHQSHSNDGRNLASIVQCIQGVCKIQLPPLAAGSTATLSYQIKSNN